MNRFSQISKRFRPDSLSPKGTTSLSRFSVKSVLSSFSKPHHSPAGEAQDSPSDDRGIAVVRERLAALKSNPPVVQDELPLRPSTHLASESEMPKIGSMGMPALETVADPNWTPTPREASAQAEPDESAGLQAQQAEPIAHLQQDLGSDQIRVSQEHSLEQLTEAIHAMESLLKTLGADYLTQQDELAWLRSRIDRIEHLQMDHPPQPASATEEPPLPQDNAPKSSSKAKQSRGTPRRQRATRSENRQLDSSDNG